MPNLPYLILGIFE